MRRLLLLVILLVSCGYSFAQETSEDQKVSYYVVDQKKANIALFLKDSNGEFINNFTNLKDILKKDKKELIFATNSGIFMQNYIPLGLHVEKGKQIRGLNKRKSGYGNFYMKPNGVFYIKNDNSAGVCKSIDYKSSGIKYASQSGPILVIDGEINPAFRKGSKHAHIRNGVGVLKDGKIVFAISEEQLSFYEFAAFFKKMGCKNALYFDGSISGVYYSIYDYYNDESDFAGMWAVWK